MITSQDMDRCHEDTINHSEYSTGNIPKNSGGYFAPGTILELDKIAGEPVDVLVNGKFVAKGEVVVIEESFGVRVTEIIK